MKKHANLTKICTVICMFLMLSLLACQFMPFWQHEGQEISIQKYIWFPVENGSLTDYFKEQVSADYTVDSVLGMPILVLAAGVLGITFSIVKPNEIWGAAFAVVCGGAGIYGYLAKQVYRMGNMWQLHFVISVVLVIVAVIGVVHWIRRADKQKLALANE